MARMSRLLRFWTQNPVVPPSLVERKRSRDVPFRSALSSASVHTCVIAREGGGGGQRRRWWSEKEEVVCVVREVWPSHLIRRLPREAHIDSQFGTTQTAEEIASQ